MSNEPYEILRETVLATVDRIEVIVGQIDGSAKFSPAKWASDELVGLREQSIAALKKAAEALITKESAKLAA